MPRIIDVDTEAFAPTYQKAYKEREPLGDVSRRRMAADFQLLGQAMPYVSEGIKGIDQYLVTPIQKALKEGREEEYKARKAGETPLELGEQWMQPLAQQRMQTKEEVTSKVPFDTSAWEKEEQEREAYERDLFGREPIERAAKWLQEAREETAQAETPQAYEWTPPVTRGKMVGAEGEARYKSTGRVEVPAYDASGRRIIKRGATIPYLPDVKAAIKSDRRQDEESQQAKRLAEFKAWRESRSEPGAEIPGGSTGMSESEWPEAELREIAAQRLLEKYRGSTRMEEERIAKEAIAGQPEEERTFKPPVAPAMPAPTAAAAPTETTPVDVVQIGHPAVTGVKVPPARKPAESEFAGAEAIAEPTQTAQMAKAAAAPAEPAKPKTLADVTDDELATVRRRLENLVKQNPADKELANRLEMVNLEQQHRGEKMEYEDWAAEARRATTPEEQARVLEMAKRARMPVEGLEGLLRSPFERAKLKALGTREEKGLFPETSRTSEEQRFLYMQKAIKQQLENEGVDPLTASRIAKNEAQAAMYGARTQETEAMLPYKMGRAEEQVQTEHERHQRMAQMRDIADQKLPNEIALMKARTAKLLADARRPRGAGGVGRSKDDLAKMIQILKAEDQKNIGNVANMYGEASRNHQTILAQAMNDERDARVAKGNYEDQLQAGAGLFGSKKAAHDLNVARFKRDADAAEEKAKLSRAQANASQTSLEQIDRQRAEALETARQNSAQVDALLEKYTERRGVPYRPREVKPVAPPARKPGTDGGAKPAAAPAAKPAPAAGGDWMRTVIENAKKAEAAKKKAQGK